MTSTALGHAKNPRLRDALVASINAETDLKRIEQLNLCLDSLGKYPLVLESFRHAALLRGFTSEIIGSLEMIHLSGSGGSSVSAPPPLPDIPLSPIARRGSHGESSSPESQVEADAKYARQLSQELEAEDLEEYVVLPLNNEDRMEEDVKMALELSLRSEPESRQESMEEADARLARQLSQQFEAEDRQWRRSRVEAQLSTEDRAEAEDDDARLAAELSQEFNEEQEALRRRKKQEEEDEAFARRQQEIYDHVGRLQSQQSVTTAMTGLGVEPAVVGRGGASCVW